MKGLNLGNTRFRYITSYASIALVSCALIGLVLFRVSVNELNEATKRQQLNKLSLAAEYLENQQKLMMEVKCKIQNTVHYKPSQLEINKYKNIVLLKDFELYKNYTPIAQEYFLFYRDDTLVYGPSSTNIFQYYMHYIVNISDYKSIYDKLNSIKAFTIICPEENENIILMAFPVYFTGKEDLTGDATLCFVVHKTDVLHRLNNTIGTFNGDIHIYFNNWPILSSSTNNTPNLHYNISSRSSLNHSKSLKVSSPDSLFTFILEIPEKGIYDQLDNYKLFSGVLVTIIAIIMIAVAAYISYYNYRPIKELVNQYESFFTSEVKSKNEIKQIAYMLNSAFEKSQDSKRELAENMTKLENQRKIIRRQLVQLLLSGDIDENIAEHEKYLDIPFKFPYYSVLVIKINPGKAERMEHLITMIENSSDETVIFYGARLKYKNSFAVLLIMNEQSQIEEVVELVKAVAHEEGINLNISIGFVCNDMNKIPVSMMDALSKYDREGFSSQLEGKKLASSFLYSDIYLPQILYELDNANYSQTVKLFAKFMDQIKVSSPPLIMLRCVFTEVINVLIRISGKHNISIPNEKIGMLMLLHDVDSFQEEISRLMYDICSQIMTDIEKREKETSIKIIDYINKHISDYDMDLTKLSDEFGLTGKQISRIIKESTGMAYKEYLTFVRISFARKMLIEDDASVADACKLAGFMNVSYFIKIFKRITGLTPADYKRKQLCINSGMQGEQ